METEIKADLKKLNKFAKAFDKTYYVKIGILKSGIKTSSKGKNKKIGGGKNKREDGMSNILLGAIHEFGSYSKNIPMRSFLRVPLKNHRQDILKKIAKPALEIFVNGNPKDAYKLLALESEAVVQKAFENSGDGAWPGLKPATIKAKGSSRPLIDTGQLRRSITSEVITK